MNYDVIIVGAGPGGIFAAYELMQHKSALKVAVFEAGHALNKRHCPIAWEYPVHRQYPERPWHYRL